MTIFKVKSNVFNEKIGEIFYKLSKNYSLLFLDEQLFISPNKYDQEIDFKKALKPQKDYLISEINAENIEQESMVVQEWCKDRFAKLELQKLEEEKQEYIKNLLEALDQFEKQLDEVEQEGDES